MFWQHLPYHFRKSVVTNLDYKSRCRLRECSKSDKELVDKSPISLESFKFRFGSGSNARLVFVDGFLGAQYHPSSDVISDFLRIFENKNSKVNMVTIEGYDGFDGRKTQVLEDLVKEIRHKGITLNIRTLEFWIHRFEANELLVKLITTMNTKFFESFIITHNLTRSSLEQLSKTDQWRNLKEVHLEKIENPDIEWFLHLRKI